MDTTTQPALTSAITDTRTAPLRKADKPANLDRLKPTRDDNRPAVAAFNSSL